MRKVSASSVLLTMMGYARVLEAGGEPPAGPQALGTVLANMAYYGYAPSCAMLEILCLRSQEELDEFWQVLQPILAEITLDNFNIGDFVVYKNFPREVLNMSEAEYWIRQIVMYIGFPNELVTQPEQERAPITEKLDLKIIAVAPDNSESLMLDHLIAKSKELTVRELEALYELLDVCADRAFDIAEFGFRVNGVQAAVHCMVKGQSDRVSVSSATDVLRLAAALSDCDPSLRGKPPTFKRFTRSQRRFLVMMLEGCSALGEDFGMRQEIWKRLLSRLHPGDYKAPRVQSAYDTLYGGSKDRFNARLEHSFAKRDTDALKLLKTRPGVFMRTLNRAFHIFGDQSLEAFRDIVPELTVEQLLRTARYLEQGSGKPRLVRPSGNWGKAFAMPGKLHLDQDRALSLSKQLRDEVARRVNIAIPEGVDLDQNLLSVALPDNGQEIDMGRGTEIDIGDDIKFIRTASYWKMPGFGNVYYDNGWSFFADDWRPMGACCWDHESYPRRNGADKCAVFSGDPTISKDTQGRGTQLIDLYLDEMSKKGIRYAVWSILCFSRRPFDQAEDVLATLQMGVNPEEGKLYDPARAQVALPVKGPETSKFVAYLDVKRRKLVVMDCALPAVLDSAGNHSTRKALSERMPAFLSYAELQPSIADLFYGAREGSVPVRKCDADAAVKGKGYVFRGVNPDSDVEPLDIQGLLALKGDVPEMMSGAA